MRVRDHSHFVVSNYDVCIPAIPPFYWRRFASLYQNAPNQVARPPDPLFYEDEQAYYLAFARQLGLPDDCRPVYRLPIAPSDDSLVSPRMVAIAPGCKTGKMGAKRWPYFPNLAESFEDVVVVGTEDDIRTRHGTVIHFPSHVRMLAGRLSLRETAELLANAGVAVGNDSGLSHIAAAVGTPTIMLFGPTPDRTLGQLPPNVMVMRTGLPCEPCWFNARFAACKGNVKCLTDLSVVAVINAITEMYGFRK